MFPIGVLFSMRLPDIVSKYREALSRQTKKKEAEDGEEKRAKVNILPVLLRAYGPSVVGGILIKVTNSFSP